MLMGYAGAVYYTNIDRHDTAEIFVLLFRSGRYWFGDTKFIVWNRKHADTCSSHIQTHFDLLMLDVEG